MITISKICPGQFGNRLMHYHNMRQWAHQLGRDYWCEPFIGSELFVDLCRTPKSPTTGVRVNWEDLSRRGKGYWSDPATTACYQHIDLTPVLGEMFFWFDGLDTTEIFKLKKRVPLISGMTHIAVHFRGGDFRQWDPKAILCSDYYERAIKECLTALPGSEVHLYTDDRTLESFDSVWDYLRCSHIVHEFGHVGDPYRDFSEMTECDAIVSSPSTFAIAAGFIGKKNKLITHSKEWLDYKVAEKDQFWVDLVNGGNRNYRLWKAL